MSIEAAPKVYAPIVRRRTPTWPTRWASYFDLTQWGGGYCRITGAPGGGHIKNGVCFDLKTGEIFVHPELKEQA